MRIISHTPEETLSLRTEVPVTLECDHCHVSFQKRAALIKGNLGRGTTHMYCSRICQGIGIRNQKMTDLICDECHTPYQATYRKDFKHRFCHQNCRKRYQARVAREGRPPRVKKEKVIKIKTQTTFDIQHVIHNLATFPIEGRIFDCSNCQSPIRRFKRDVLKSKSGLFYCSKGCRMKHYNANVLTRSSNQRSKVEDLLIGLIKADFPTLEILANDRTRLPSQLEIDVLIPTAKLAIELNGPVHYLPIYGEDRFRRVQEKDALKALEIHEQGLSLMVLDVSRLNSTKQQRETVTQYYLEHVKPRLTN